MTTSPGARPPCAACAARERITVVRDDIDGSCDKTLGLTPVGNDLFECPACGVRYRRELDETSFLKDYDDYVFTRLDPLPPAFGCARCGGGDAEAAWTASRAARLSSPVQESHFSVHLTRCACGQRFATVFTERVDWANGEDDQTWLAVPVSAEEQARIEAAPDVVADIGRDRRYLLRAFPTGGSLSVQWRDRGFAVGPHD